MAKDLQLSFTDKEITPWGGLSLMSRLLKKAGFREALQGAGLPLKGSNRGYDPEQLIEQFLIRIWYAADRFEHTEVTRSSVLSLDSVTVAELNLDHRVCIAMQEECVTSNRN